MRVTRLEFSGLRCFERGEMAPGPGLNLLVGPNGSGKSSVLEALHLMGYGRSFRGRVRDGLVRQGDAALEVLVANPPPHVTAGDSARGSREPEPEPLTVKGLDR